MCVLIVGEEIEQVLFFSVRVEGYCFDKATIATIVCKALGALFYRQLVLCPCFAWV